MKKRRAIRLIGLGIMLSQPMSYVLDATIVKAVEDAPSDTVSLPTRISIKAGQPSAQVQATIECTDPSIETQTAEATADDTGRATIHYNRVEGMVYTISLTVNGKIYTMTDDAKYSSTCDGLTVEGIRAGMDADGNQVLTVAISLADVPETPKPEPDPEEPEEPKPETSAEDDEQKKEDVDTPKKEDAKVPEKGMRGDSAQVQKVKDDSTMAQGMPTGCRVWNPLVWLINLFRI